MRATRWFRALTTGTRVIVGGSVAVLLVIVVVAFVRAPLPALSRDALRIIDTPTPAQSVAVCPGPLLATGRIVGAASEVSIASAADLVSGSADGTPEQDRLIAPFGEGSAVLRLSPTSEVPASIAAAQSSAAGDEDLSGFAAAACRAPEFDSWLVAGSTTTGASDLVMIANPGAVPATVQVSVYTSGGESLPPGGRDVVVDAGSQLVLPLAGLALGEIAPVVRVQAEGAPVVASLQTSRTETLQPVGLDVTGPTAVPAGRQVIVGLVTPVPGEGPASNVVTASVRLLSPSQPVTATIRVRGIGDAGAVAAPIDVPLDAGVPREVDLPGLSAGTYTIEVEAPAPVVAAGWSSTAAAGERDHAWIAASPRLEDASYVAVAPPPGDTSAVFRASAAESSVQVTLAPLDGGASVELSLPAGGSGSMSLASGAWRIETTGSVFASIGYASASALAGYPVRPSAQAAAAVVVVP